MVDHINDEVQDPELDSAGYIRPLNRSDQTPNTQHKKIEVKKTTSKRCLFVLIGIICGGIVSGITVFLALKYGGMSVTPCTSNPCLNGGKCSNIDSGYTCTCPSSHNGTRCEVDGEYTTWTSWDKCSFTCGGGTQSRTRSCTNPKPANGVAQCSRPASESQSCNNNPCSVNGEYTTWTGWGTCSFTCGGGTQSRTRSCTNPTPQNGGAQCSGPASDSQSCNTNPCPVDGDYATWTSWDTCSFTCGGGTQSRTRTCTNPIPQHGGAQCLGPASDSQSCNTNPCPVDGDYTTWTSWDTCSFTCGRGTQSRTRTCTNPTPQHGGAQCSGPASDSQSCNTNPCPVDGAWGSWSSWGTCSVTCGSGQMSRSRNCSNPYPQNGGLSCSGIRSNFESCSGQSGSQCQGSASLPVLFPLLVAVLTTLSVAAALFSDHS